MDAEPFAFDPFSLLLGVVVGVLVTVLVAWFLWRREGESRLAAGRAQRDAEVARLEVRAHDLGERLEERAASLERATQELAALREQLGDARLRHEKLAALGQANEQSLARLE